MTPFLVFAAAWLVGAALGFWALVALARKDGDVTVADAGVLAFIALLGGPIAVGSAAIAWFIQHTQAKPTRVLWRRKP